MSESAPFIPPISPNLSDPTSAPMPPHNTFDSGMFPSRHRPLLQFLLDHNPLLLLSTVLMLLGCYLINSVIDLQAGDHVKLWSLLGVTNLYELCIIPLGLILIRRTRGVARDGLWLILFEMLFLVNGTFMNVDPAIMGWHVNLGLLALAIVKMGIVLRGLEIGFSIRTFGFLAAQIALIYLLPIFLRHESRDGVVPQPIMYALWWIVGMLPWAYDLLASADDRWGRAKESHGRLDLVQQVVRRTYLIGIWLMLVAHLGFSHWAYHSDFSLADLAPVLLGLAIAMGRAFPTNALVAWRMVLPLAAMLVSLTAPAALQWNATFNFTLHPALFVTGMMIITYAYMISLWAALWATVSVAAAATSLLLQNYIAQAIRWMVLALADLARWLTALFPTTPLGWGIWSVIAAFVLLALGGALALRRPRPLS